MKIRPSSLLCLLVFAGAMSASPLVTIDGPGVRAPDPAGDGAKDDQFASATAIEGDLMVAGAPMDDVGTAIDQGSAYVYRRRNGTWTLEQKLVGPDGHSGDLFGTDVDIASGRIFIGVPGRDQDGRDLQGAAYVFERTNGNWQAVATLDIPSSHATASPSAKGGSASGDRFGNTLDADGERVVIGAYAWRDAQQEQVGAAFVFERQGSAWTLRQRLNGSGMSRSFRFGEDVAVRGTTIAVADDLSELTAGIITGSVHVFELGATFTQSHLATDAGRPYRIAIGDNLIAVGNLTSNASEAYAIRRTPNGWSAALPLALQREQIPDRTYQTPVAISGTRAVFACANELQVFELSSGTPTATVVTLPASNDAKPFASTAAVDGETMLAGGPFRTFDGVIASGTIDVFNRIGGQWPRAQTVGRPRGNGGSYFGANLAADDQHVLIGEPNRRSDSALVGQAWIARIDANGVAGLQSLTPADLPDGAQFGYATAVKGDTAVVGAPLWSNTDSCCGAAVVYRRVNGSWQEETRLYPPAGSGIQEFGRSVAVVEDRIAVGAPNDAQGFGRVVLFERRNGAWQETHQFSAPSGSGADRSQSRFGAAVVLQDNEIFIGVPRAYSGAPAGQGMVFVHVTNGSVWTESARLTSVSPSPEFEARLLGAALAVDGDILAIGAPMQGWTAPDIYESGRVHIVRRIGGIWTPQEVLIASDADRYARFGASLALSGTSLLVGAYRHDVAGALLAGHAYRFRQVAGQFQETERFELNPANESDALGSAVGLSGPHLIFGAMGRAAPGATGNPAEGAIYAIIDPEMLIFRAGFE